MAMKNYETGMRVVYDEKSKTVAIVFRGRRHELEGPFATASEGTKAGEDYCRRLGWDCSSPDPHAGRSILRRSRR
jgi:hypothetical protein